MEETFLTKCAILSKLAENIPGECAEHQVYPLQVTTIPLYYDGGYENVQAFMWISDAHVYIAFHANYDPRNDLVQLDNISKANVHFGYLQKIIIMAEKMLQDIRQYEEVKGFLKIIFTGHGYGGAVATLASVYFASFFPEKHISCITFSAPPVGDLNFKRLYARNVQYSVRIVEKRSRFYPSLAYRHVHKGIKFADMKKVGGIPGILKLLLYKTSPQPIPSVDTYIQSLINNETFLSL